jgi:hypothetical protein
MHPMKRILSVLLFTAIFSLACHAEPYFPGGWYITKKPRGDVRRGGGMEVVFYDDFSMTLSSAIGLGEDDEPTEGTFTETTKYIRFVVTDVNGNVWRGRLNKYTGQLTGRVRSANYRYRGKFQCSREDDGDDSAE